MNIINPLISKREIPSEKRLFDEKKALLYFKDLPDTLIDKSYLSTNSVRQNDMFFLIIHQFTVYGINQFRLKINMNYEKKIDILYTKKEMYKNIYNILYEKISQTIQSVLVHDINQYRLKQHGNNDESKQYNTYIKCFFKKEYINSFFLEYKLLIQKLYALCYYFPQHFTRCILRYGEERHQLVSKGLIPYDDSSIFQIEAVGDAHYKNNHVFLVTTCKGNKIVYKPHYNSALAIYNPIIEYLNTYDKKNPPIHLIKYIQKERHMWVEYIQHEACKDNQELNLFYYNMGKILFVIYVLNGSDIHNENIIAKGSSPIVIDFETITGAAIEKKENFLSQKLAYSVLHTRMLPVKHGRTNEGIRDFSAIGTRMKIRSIQSKLINQNTSAVREVKIQHIQEDINKHLPSINNFTVDFYEYIEDIITGFKEAYNLVLSEKQKFADIIENSSTFKVRVIWRSTKIYSEIQKKMNTASLLEEKTKTALYLNKLLSSNTNLIINEEIINSEINQLLDGDIPHFLIDFQTGQYQEESINKGKNSKLPSIKHTVMKKIKRLSHGDLIFQTELIRVSLTNQDDQLQWMNQTYMSVTQNSCNHIAKVKQEILYTVLEAMYTDDQDNNNVQFLGLKKDWQGNYRYDVLNSGMYDGVLGVLLYLEQAMSSEFYHTWHTMQEKLIISIIESVSHHFQHGFVHGSSSLITFISLTTSLSQELKQKYIKELYMRINQLLDQDEYNDSGLDILGGTAGLILSLSKFHQHSPDQTSITLIDRLGTYLLQKLKFNKDIREYECLELSNYEESTRGFAHGFTGYSVALYLCYKITGKHIYMQATEEALNREKECLHAEKSLSWCKGWTGIGVAKLILIQQGYDDPGIYSQLMEAKRKVFENLYSYSDYCLCHGYIGALDFIESLRTARYLDKDEEKKYRDELTKFIQQFKLENYNLQKISLFTGLSGVGYLLNRIENKTESILGFGV